MDKYDQQILEILQRDGRLSWTELAEQIHLSTSATLRRVQALQTSGVLQGFQAKVDAEKLGYAVRALVEVNVDRTNTTLAEEFKTQVALIPEIINCHMVSGTVDFVLEVVAKDLRSYADFMEKKILNMNGVKDASSKIIFQTIKEFGALPVNDIEKSQF